MQIDLRRLEKADDAEEPEWFAELLKKVDIGEIWPPAGALFLRPSRLEGRPNRAEGALGAEIESMR